MKMIMYSGCLEKLFSLPKKVQNSVIQFQKDFLKNPYTHAVNLEKIHTFKDDSMRTARITLDYRVVIGILPNDTYCMLYVDHHDEAMRWAENKRLNINQYTDSIQIVPVEIAAPVVVPVPSIQELPATQTNPFDSITDEQFLQIGVPDTLLELVRKVTGYDSLEQIESMIPDDVFSHLFYLLGGEASIQSIINEVNEGKAMLGNINANNRQHFVEITDDDFLEKMINGDIEKWQVFLHPSQTELVEKDYKGSMKVTGGAGTGKTVAAIHRLKRLAKNATKESVLYTTFTNALVSNIMRCIGAMDINKKAVVIETIDTVVLRIAKMYDIADKDTLNSIYSKSTTEKIDKLWDEIAIQNDYGFDSSFLKREYEDVILFNDIQTLSQYYRQPRTGRNKPLSNVQKRTLWAVFELFTEKCKQNKCMVPTELYNVVTNYLKENKIFPYAHIIADEVQDFSNPQLRFLRALVPESENDLFLVGDPYQNVYNTKINFSKAGINIRGKRSKRLRINYRTTEEIKRTAINVLSDVKYDNFDGETESLSGYISLVHGQKPEYIMYDDKEKEIEAIKKLIFDLHESKGYKYNEIVVATYFNVGLKSIVDMLHSNDIPYEELSKNKRNPEGVIVSTMHMMKGLESKVVILADVNKQTFPYHSANWNTLTPKEQKLSIKSQKALMYMALTRAVHLVYIVGFGQKAAL
jgi:hypothetical protein